MSEGNIKKNPLILITMSFIKMREFPILVALALIVLFISLFTTTFLVGSNLYLVSRQIALVAIVAFGELFVILTGGIDLSVGSMMGLSGIISGLAMAAGINPFLAVIIGLLTGVCLGLLSGFLIAYVGIAPFIITLSMLSIARGLILIITQGWPVTAIPKSFLAIGQGNFLALPIPLIILLGCALIVHLVLTLTAFGRRIYAIGGNEQATFLSGVDVKKIKLAIYGISAFFASMVGIILVARFNSAQATTGEGWELDAIAAAVIGGTSLMGGTGSVLGVLIGASIMGVLRNGLVLMRVSPYWQTAIIGCIIIFAALIDRIKNLQKK
jgi:ribose transport system permease protein